MEIYSSSSFKCAKNYIVQTFESKKKKKMPRVPLNCNNIIPHPDVFYSVVDPCCA